MIRPGDTVRFETQPRRIWFYCHVEDLLDDGNLLCSVVDAQSWPDLALDGILPGRKYALQGDQVLSVVKSAEG